MIIFKDVEREATPEEEAELRGVIEVIQEP